MRAMLLLSLFFFAGPSVSSVARAAEGSLAGQSLSEEAPEKGIGNLLVSLDYNSWFEKLTVQPVTGAKQESQAQYFGFGVSLEKNWYRPTWGWGLGAGALTGRATGGDPSGPSTYFEARVPWWAVRVAPRLFYRLTPEADFGLSLLGLYKQAMWPNGSSNSTVHSGADGLAGLSVDLRLRLSAKLEMIQSFGVLYADSSTYWRLGLGYHL